VPCYFLYFTFRCEFCGSSVPLENLHVHQRQCLGESQGFQIPLLVEGDDGFFQEIAATRGRNTDDHVRRDRVYSNSVSHDSTQAPSEAGAEGNSIVALPCENLWRTVPFRKINETPRGMQPRKRKHCGPHIFQETRAIYPTSGFGALREIHKTGTTWKIRSVILP